jgi:hypothetical protein
MALEITRYVIKTVFLRNLLEIWIILKRNNKSLPYFLMSLKYIFVYLFGELKAHSVQVLVNFVLV